MINKLGQERVSMARDFLNTHNVVGLSPERVVSLLGEPDLGVDSPHLSGAVSGHSHPLDAYNNMTWSLGCGKVLDISLYKRRVSRADVAEIDD